MPKLTIDGMEIEVEAGTSVLQAAEALGIEVPRFCFHDRLSVAGNCRMCLVEVEGGPPKPAASCCMAVGDGMVVHTNSEMADKARKGVMEFLLINHPLDCPICDQGGECDLQDQAVAYGYDRSRYNEDKRAVKDKELGPLVKTVMTRCINCTRCVRFAEEVAGVPVLGQTNRGEAAEVGTYVEKTLATELSGNLVDICPVGALTSKPYAFTARPWELKKTSSIDVMDAVGSNIRIDARGDKVLRVLPRLHEDINEEWISDKTRHAIDGLSVNRLDRPWVRNNGELQEVSWEDALVAVAKKMSDTNPNRTGAVVGHQCDLESMLALKDLMAAKNVKNIDCRQLGENYDTSCRAGYLFNTTIAGIEQSDAILLIGTNPRTEASLVNARILKTVKHKRAKVGLIGAAADLTYSYDHIGTDVAALEKLLGGKGDFAKILKKAERPMLILGEGALRGEDGAVIQAMAAAIADKYGMISDGWNGYNMLHLHASRVGALDMGFVPSEGALSTSQMIDDGVDFLYVMDADELDLSTLPDKTFVVYQGHHGDKVAALADVVLPSAAYSEKDGIYVNMEGRPQRGRRAIFPPAQAKEDWRIIRALSEAVGSALPYDDLTQLRDHIGQQYPQLVNYDAVQSALWSDFGASGDYRTAPFEQPVRNFYKTCSISRASKTMDACTSAFVGEEDNAELEEVA